MNMSNKPLGTQISWREEDWRWSWRETYWEVFQLYMGITGITLKRRKKERNECVCFKVIFILLFIWYLVCQVYIYILMTYLRHPPPYINHNCYLFEKIWLMILNDVFFVVSMLYLTFYMVYCFNVMLCCCCIVVVIFLCCCCDVAMMMLWCCCDIVVLMLCCCCDVAVLLWSRCSGVVVWILMCWCVDMLVLADTFESHNKFFLPAMDGDMKLNSVWKWATDSINKYMLYYVDCKYLLYYVESFRNLYTHILVLELNQMHISTIKSIHLAVLPSYKRILFSQNALLLVSKIYHGAFLLA